MDPASIALGTVPLVGLFITFFDLCEKIHSIRGRKGALRQQEERLRLEAERVRHVKRQYDSRRWDEATEDLLRIILHSLNNQLKDIEVLFSRHIEKDGKAVNGTVTDVPESTFTTKRGIIPIVRWMTADPGDIQRMLDTLHFTTNSLRELVTSESERFRNDFLLCMDAISHPQNTTHLAPEYFPEISKAARVKQLLQERQDYSPALVEGDSYSPKYPIPVNSIKWHGPGGLNNAIAATWAIGSYAHDRVIVEWRTPFMGGNLARPEVDERLDKLCELLQAMHVAEVGEKSDFPQRPTAQYAVEFGQLPCLGWTQVSNSSLARIGVVFRYPVTGQNLTPHSLYHRIQGSRRLGLTVPVLGQRFSLALGIARAVANIIGVGWVHRAIRSDNLLYFGAGDIFASKLYLVGFTYARDGDRSLTEFSDLPQAIDWALYRPKFQAASNEDYTDIFDDDRPTSSTAETLSTTAAHDMYGLGMVLLEIGHWTTVGKMARVKGIDGNIEKFCAEELGNQVGKLGARCGSIYEGVVRKCLDLANWDGKELMANLADIIQSLMLCNA